MPENFWYKNNDSIQSELETILNLSLRKLKIETEEYRLKEIMRISSKINDFFKDTEIYDNELNILKQRKNQIFNTDFTNLLDKMSEVEWNHCKVGYYGKYEDEYNEKVFNSTEAYDKFWYEKYCISKENPQKLSNYNSLIVEYYDMEKEYVDIQNDIFSRKVDLLLENWIIPHTLAPRNYYIISRWSISTLTDKWLFNEILYLSWKDYNNEWKCLVLEFDNPKTRVIIGIDYEKLL